MAAPVVLARTVEWQPPASDEWAVANLNLDPITLALLAAFVVSLLLFVVIALVGWRRRRTEDAQIRARRDAKFV